MFHNHIAQLAIFIYHSHLLFFKSYLRADRLLLLWQWNNLKGPQYFLMCIMHNKIQNKLSEDIGCVPGSCYWLLHVRFHYLSEASPVLCSYKNCLSAREGCCILWDVNHFYDLCNILLRNEPLLTSQ